MADDDAENVMWSIRPDPVDDDEIVPGRGIDDCQRRDGNQQQQDSAADTAMQERKRDDQWQTEKEGKELSVAHSSSFFRQGLRAYQDGTLAAVVAAVVGAIVAVAAGWPSPLEATGEALMEWTPLALANLLLAHLAGFARPAALLGGLAAAMLVGGTSAVIGAAAGVISRNRWLGLPLAGSAFALVFLWLIPPAGDLTEATFVVMYPFVLLVVSTPRGHASDRRQFLVRSSIILGGAAALLALFSLRPTLHALALTQIFPYRRPRGMAVPGLGELVTPASHFYRMDRVLEPPEIAPSDWRLTLTGAVRSPLTLDFQQLLVGPRRDRYVTMECVDNPVGGPLISTALWTGTPLVELLHRAGIHGNTLVFHGADGYSESASFHDIVGVGALLVYAMNGQILRREHGYPVRVLLPGVYGFKSVKWLTGIDVRDDPAPGDWSVHGWTPGGHIHTTTRIDVARRAGNEILLAGTAFAGIRGVRAVEVRVNGGPWREASLGTKLSDSAWVQWAIRLHGSGTARIEARAIDGLGRIQTARQHDPFPGGATGWASLTV